MVDAGLILQLVGAAHVGLKKLCVKVKEFQHAEEHVKELCTELQGTETVLRNSQGILERVFNQHGTHLIDLNPINKLAYHYTEICQIVKDVTSDGSVNKFRWLKQASDCRTLEARLHNARQNVYQLTTELQLQYLVQAQAALSPIQIDERMTQGNQEVVTIMTAEESSAEQNPAALQLQWSESSGPRRHSAAAIMPSFPSAPSLSSLQPTASKSPCAQTCECSCHYVKQRRSSEYAVRAVPPKIGPMGSLKFVKLCSVISCKAARKRTGQITFALPARRYFHKILTVSLLCEGLKVRPYLKVPIFLPEYSDIIKYTLNGDLKNLKRLFLTPGASPNATSLDGWSVLHTSSYMGNPEIVKFFIDKGANQDAIEVKSRKAVHLAMIKSLKKNASQDEKAVVELFTDAQQNFKKDFRLTPIHEYVLCSSLYGNSQLPRPSLTELLELVHQANNAPASTDWQTWKGFTSDHHPLFIAVRDFFHSSAEKIRSSKDPDRHVWLDALNQPDAHGWTPLHWATYTGRLEETKSLLETEALTMDLTPSRRNLLHHAAESGDGNLLAYLLEHPCRVTMYINEKDTWEETPLHIAATRSAKSVQLLLEQGAKVDAVQCDKQNPLHWAYQAEEKERIEILKLLCHYDFTESIVYARDDGGRTPIFEYLNSPECFRFLRGRGARVDGKDTSNRSLLHHGCAVDCPAEVFQEIISGCSKRMIKQKDDNGITPLEEAFDRNSPSCAALLLQTDVRFDVKMGKDGWNILHYAASMADETVLELVLGKFKTQELIGFTKRGESAEQLADASGKNEGRVRELLEGFKKEERKLLIARENAASGKLAARQTYGMIRP